MPSQNKNPKKIDVSIIIINWNNYDVIFNCLDSIKKTVKRISYEIIVVDNNSTDGSKEKIKKQYKWVQLIENKINNLFAKANNQGLELAKGEFIFILNSDTVLTENALDILTEYAEKNKSQIYTSTLINKDNSIQFYMHRSFPNSLSIILAFFFKTKGWFKRNPILIKYLLLDHDFTKTSYVDQAAGAAMLIHKTTIKKIGGLFDEKNFPLFFNDVDTCYRAAKKNCKTLHIADSYIYHLKGESVKKQESLVNYYRYAISLQLYFKKHKLWFSYISCAGIVKTLFSLFLAKEWVLYTLKKSTKQQFSNSRKYSIAVLREKFI
jgi:GT2 family glycosyltransferase